MTTAPKVFISATSGDLRSIRQIVKEALLTINCHPVEQTNFAPDFRTVDAMLEEKIGECQAMIHIAGMRYGAEPAPATLPPNTERCSYTQMEYEMGRRLQAKRGDKRFRVYTFVCPENFPYDEEQDAETEEKRALQLAHRERLLTDTHLHEGPKTHEEVKHRTLSLQEQVRLIQIEQGGIKRTTTAIFASLLLLAAITVGGFWLLNKKGEAPPPPPHKGEISLVIIMGEDVEYEQIMRDAFLAKMESELAKRGYTLKATVEKTKFKPGDYAGPSDPKAAKKWSALLHGVENEFAHKEIGYFVTLGTHATNAVLEDGLMEKYGACLIYLGVSDPVKAGFVNKRDVAGVQYGTGGRDYGVMIDNLFKRDQNLVFLYNAGVIQDEFVSEELRKLNESFAGTTDSQRRQPRFFLDQRPNETPIALADIQQVDEKNSAESPIYFAWYGLDNILGDTDNEPELASGAYWVVPSTYSTLNLKNAGIVVSVDDKLVGEMGADLLLRKIDDPQVSLSQEPISLVSFHTWICRNTVEDNGMNQCIKPEILIDTNRQNYPWITFEDAR